MQIRSIFSYQYTDVTGQLRRRMRTVFPSGLGGCAAGCPPSYPLGRAGEARPLALPLGELARRSRD